MYNNIKSKALVWLKRSVLFVFVIVISMFTMVACKEEQVTTTEFEIVSCYVEFRNITNGFGGIIRTDQYLHYGYVNDNGKVIFDEIYFDYVDFQIAEETPKLIITATRTKKEYAFYLTREMYNNLNSNEE